MKRVGGFSIVEVLVGLVLIMGAMFGISHIAEILQKSQSNANKTTAVESIVTAIIAALSRESGFVDPDGVLDQYDETLLSNFELNYFGLQLAEKRAGVWIPKYFNAAGDSCNPGIFDSECNIRVDFNLIVDTSSGNAFWKADYDVSIVDNPRAAIPVKLASNPATISISRKFTSLMADKKRCDEGEVTFRGYDINGDAVCWEQAPSSQLCNSNEFPSGYKFNGPSGQILPVCQTLRGIDCDDDFFALENINPRYIDSRIVWNGAQAGNCRFLTKDRTPAGVPSDPSHPQKCPQPSYQFDGTECVLKPTLQGVRPAVQK